MLSAFQQSIVAVWFVQSSTINYGGLAVNIKEGPLGDGLGARVWVVAHTLCRSLFAPTQNARAAFDALLL
jgi:hypothetical protein